MSPPRSDQELLHAWRAGDLEAADLLFHRHFDAVRRFFINKIAEEQVADLTQVTFERCVAAQERFEGRSSFKTYLLSIAHNVLREQYRLRKRTVGYTATDDLPSALDLGISPSSAYAEKQEQRILLEALRRLPWDLQVVMELHYWEQMTGQQIAEALGIPLNTVYGRLHRARCKLEAIVRSLDEPRALLASTVSKLEDWAQAIATHLGGKDIDER